MDNIPKKLDTNLRSLSQQELFGMRAAMERRVKDDYVVDNAIFPGDVALPTPHDPEYPHHCVVGFKFAVVLIAALIVGPDPNRLGEFTGYDSGFIQQIETRMREAELWVGDDVHCDHWNWVFQGKYIVGGIDEFWLDVALARGLVMRIGDREGKYHYFKNGPVPPAPTSAAVWMDEQW